MAKADFMKAIYRNWIRSTTDGAVQLGNKAVGSVSQAGADTAALILGSGTTTTRVATTTADKNFVGLFTESSAATGDCRGIYVRTYFSSTGSGEALRAYATVNAASAATGGTINGAHISTSIAVGATVSGQANAVRITLDAAAATRTLSTNLAALMLESNIATGNTAGALNSFIRVVDTGAVKITKLLRLPTVASAGILAVHTTDAITHSIRCIDDAGTVFYIMATTTATNRTGGA